MKRSLILLAFSAFLVFSFFLLRGTEAHKFFIVSQGDRSGELLAWVDKKSASGELALEKDDIGSYVFVGSYDVDIDFDRSRYGLREGAAARVVVDELRKPVSVVFIDGSRCGIVVALRAGKDIQETFGSIPSDFRVGSGSSRIGMFCVEKD